jgi:hypothetical protein
MIPVFLASSQAGFITGERSAVNGGHTIAQRTGSTPASSRG